MRSSLPMRFLLGKNSKLQPLGQIRGKTVSESLDKYSPLKQQKHMFAANTTKE